MTLPTLMDVLDQRLRERDCEHEWRFIGYSSHPDLHSCYRCEKCGRSRETRATSAPASDPKAS